MECNIDDQGVKFRRVWGIMTLFTGIAVAALALWSHIWWFWIIAAVATAAGIFALYESRKRWCALRAMGLKTRI